MNHESQSSRECINHVGFKLMEFAEQNPASSRGLIHEFFPYIYEVSARMSSRATSAYLRDEHGIGISPSTITRALRNPEPFFDASIDAIEPAVAGIRQGFGDGVSSVVLEDEAEWIEHVHKSAPDTGRAEGAEFAELMAERMSALESLEDCWWCYGPRFRTALLDRLRAKGVLPKS